MNQSDHKVLLKQVLQTERVCVCADLDMIAYFCMHLNDAFLANSLLLIVRLSQIYEVKILNIKLVPFIAFTVASLEREGTRVLSSQKASQELYEL